MKTIFLRLFIFLLLTSCCNDDDMGRSGTVVNNYGLKIGNSWTYQFNDLQGSWNEHMQTVVITGVNNINGEDYFVQEIETTFDDGSPNVIRNEFVRVDSNGYLINSDGFILAHPTDFNFLGVQPATALGSELEYRRYLESIGLTVIVPAGTYENVFNMDHILYNTQNQEQQGNGTSKFMYTTDIGLIKEKISFTQSNRFVYEKVLTSHNVN